MNDDGVYIYIVYTLHKFPVRGSDVIRFTNFRLFPSVFQVY